MPAVFSDVEGTLVDGSIPQVALAVGRANHLFAMSKRLQIATLERVGRLAPPKIERTLQLLCPLARDCRHATGGGRAMGQRSGTGPDRAIQARHLAFAPGASGRRNAISARERWIA